MVVLIFCSVISFAVYNTLSTDWVRSKPLLGGKPHRAQYCNYKKTIFGDKNCKIKRSLERTKKSVQGTVIVLGKKKKKKKKTVTPVRIII